MFELGRSLHEARVRRGLELKQVAAETRIRTRYLRALEEERFELIPGSVYAKGFLRAYADHLGLDSQLFLDEYNARFVDEQTLPAPPQLKLRPRPLRSYVAGAAVLLVAVGGALLAWQLSGSSARNAHSLVTSTAAVRASVRARPLPAASSAEGRSKLAPPSFSAPLEGPAGCRFTGKAVPAGTSSREHSSRATRGDLAKGLSGYASARPGTWSQVVEDAGFRSHRPSRRCS
jgi:cytoskeletal protein RodZ